MKYLLILMTTMLALNNLQAQGKFEERVSKIGSDDLHLIEFAAGDTLIYEVNAGGNTYEFVAVLQTYDLSGKGFSFDWKMTAPVNLSGTVSVLADAYLNSRSYINRFAGGSLVLKDACTVFLTAQNFGEMPQKESRLILDGDEETFYRPDNDEVPFKVKIGGEEYTLDGFKINNKKDGKGDKTIVIQGISSQSLILEMELGFKIRLKEIK
jgi:hypothetical protein